MPEDYVFSFVISIIQAIAGTATAIALILVYKTYSASNKKWQFELARDVQTELIRFSEQITSADTNEDRKLLVERLFNILEWLGFLINKKQIQKKELTLYFKEGVIKYYENTFVKSEFITDEQRSDKDEFREFKQLYNDYKSGKYD